jgi:hypothetical protein
MVLEGTIREATNVIASCLERLREPEGEERELELD